jgi:hypothetical protein
MESAYHCQANKLQALISAATAGRAAAMQGRLFCSRPGLALVNAAFDLFECDGLYDFAGDVAREIAVDRDQRGRQQGRAAG